MTKGFAKTIRHLVIRISFVIRHSDSGIRARRYKQTGDGDLSRASPAYDCRSGESLAVRGVLACFRAADHEFATQKFFVV